MRSDSGGAARAEHASPGHWRRRQPAHANPVRTERLATCAKPACSRQLAPEPLLLQCGGLGCAGSAEHTRPAADAGEICHAADQGAPAGRGQLAATHAAPCRSAAGHLRQTGVPPAPLAQSAERQLLRSCARGCAIPGAELRRRHAERFRVGARVCGGVARYRTELGGQSVSRTIGHVTARRFAVQG